MIWTNKRLTLLVGNYGSGKTEIALNGALTLRATGRATALVDLDIVNPYFRSGEQAALLEKEGIRVLMPSFAMSTVDIPALPAEIQSVFDAPNEGVIFDVGGDDTGAAALGRYAPFFKQEQDQVQTFLVVNCMRPLTQSAEDVLELMERIESRGRQPISGLINNTNLANITTIQQLLDGQTILDKVAAAASKPIVLITGTAQLLGQLPKSLAPLAYPIQRYMKPEWMEV